MWIFLADIFCLAFFAVPMALFPMCGSAVVLLFSCMESGRTVFWGFQLDRIEYAQIAFVTGSLIWQRIAKESFDWRVGYPIAGIILACWASVPLSVNPAASVQAAASWSLNAATAYCIAYFASTSPAARVVDILKLTLAFSFALALWQLIVNQPSHLSGGFSHWNYFAFFLVVLFPFMTSGFSLSGFSIAPPAKITGIDIGFLVGSILFLYWTHSKSGWALFAFAWIVMARYGLIRSEAAWLSAACVFLGIAAILLGSLVGFYHPIESFYGFATGPSFQERAQNGILSLMMFSQNPFIGVGTGQYEAYARWAYPNTAFELTPMHSTVTTTLSEMGLFGGIALVNLMAQLAGLAKRQSDGLAQNITLASTWIVCAGAFIFAIHLHAFTWCAIGLLYGIALHGDHNDMKKTRSN